MITHQQPDSIRHLSWSAVCELVFISTFFNWLFLLASRLAEPCMLLSVIYVILDAALPAVRNTLLYNLSLGIMIAAPEIILPGSFVLAKQEKAKGNDTRPLFFVCWLFVILTLTTLLSLFVLHLNQDTINLIMCCRCGTGVAYSILLRMLTHMPTSHPTPTAQSQQIVTPALVAYLSHELSEQFSPATILPTLQKELRRTVEETVSYQMKTTVLPTLTTALTPTLAETANPTDEDTTAHLIETTRTATLETGNQQQTREDTPAEEEKTPIPITRRIVTDDEVRAAYKALKREQEKVSAEALRLRAGIGKARACKWLRTHTGEDREANVS